MTFSEYINLSFEELRRRKVFRVAAAYLVAAWVVVESSSIILPAFGFADRSVSLVIVMAMFGFPAALTITWFFDLTSKGVVRTPDPDEGDMSTLNIVNVSALVLMLMIGGFLSYRLLMQAGEFGPGVATASVSSPRPTLLRRDAAGADAVETDAVAEVRSIAVLPLVNMTGDPEHEYFSDGMTEELLNGLAQVEGLRVAARTSSFAFKNATEDVRSIGEKLGVNTILEGSVRKSGTTFRITAQLINVADGYHIWSSTYDRRLDDIFAVQDEISRAVVQALQLQLLGDRGKALVASAAIEDSAGYDEYLLGLHKLHQRTEQGMRAAIGHFETAVAIDGGYAPGWAGIVDAWIHLYSRGMTDFESARTGADTALKQALRYGANLSEVQASLGLYRRMIDHDLEGSELALRRAIDINPNYAMAHLWLANTLSRQGRFREAFAELERAEQIDPLHPAVITNIANYLFSMGRYDEGVAKLERVLEIDPGLTDVYSVLTEWSGEYGHLSDGMRRAREALDDHPDDPLLLLQVGMLYTRLGDLGAASEYLERARTLDPNSDLVFSSTCAYYFANEQYADLAQMIDERGFTSADNDVRRMVAAWRGLAAVMLGEYRAGADALMGSLGDTDTIAFNPSLDMYLLSYLAYAYQQLGQTERAQETLDEALAVAARARGQGWRTPRLNYGIAAVYALQDRADEAIGQLRNAVDGGLRAPGLTGTDPQFAGLQGLEAFRLLVAEVDADLNRQRAEVLHDAGDLTTAQATP